MNEELPQHNREYNHLEIEKKWQNEWKQNGIHEVQNKVEGKKNYFALVEFTYPSGNLHVGHWYAFAVPDIFARYKRMQGYNVLYPMGFDAFGLPAENAAIKLGADPKVLTYEQMEKMRMQFYSMGAMFPWDREIISCDPAYYKWTQWMFNQFLKNDLVYRDVTKVNWCPKDQTILANEQVADNKCERCGTEVVIRDQEQWMLRITKYADRLIDDLDEMNWPNEIKLAQKNWIGRSEGSEIGFSVKNNENKINVFTTRADTLFGVTYVVLAPEHELVLKLKDQIENWDEVENYIKDTKKKGELERQQSKEKTGVELKGVKVINPANGEIVAVWIADYVLASYGTGAVMAVPAHDERDFEFAKKYNLEIKNVIFPKNENVFGVGALLQTTEGKFLFQKRDMRGNEPGKTVTFGGKKEENETIIKCLLRELKEELDFEKTENNKITPASIFIQDGKPHVFFFITNVEKEKLVLHEGESIVEYDSLQDFLNNADTSEKQISVVKNFLEKNKPFLEYGTVFGSGEFDGMESEDAKQKITEFVGGKIMKTYRLRDWGISRQRYWGTPIPIVYDPQGKAHAIPDENLPWILPTDVDHTPDGTAPLARSRELLERTENIFGKGWKPEVETMDTFVDSSWYFYRYLDPKNDNEFSAENLRDAWMPIDLYMGGAEHTTMHLLYSRFWTKALFDLGLVKENESYKVRRNRGLILGPDGEKMSKSKGNVINPDEIVDRLGADTVRLYLAFMGPYGVTTNYPWDPNGVVGVRRFLERVWRLAFKISESANFLPQSLLHKTIKKVTEDMEEFKFNTAISAMMILLNVWEKDIENISILDFKIFLQLLSPFAPHMTEELWFALGEKESIHLSTWPKYDEKLLVESEITLAIQINGKVRSEIRVPVEISEDELKNLVFTDPKVLKYAKIEDVIKFLYIKGKIVNIVSKTNNV